MHKSQYPDEVQKEMHDEEHDDDGTMKTMGKEYQDATEFDDQRSYGKQGEEPMVLCIVKQGLFENIKIDTV